jgi:hypothetical protein
MREGEGGREETASQIGHTQTHTKQKKVKNKHTHYVVYEEIKVDTG